MQPLKNWLNLSKQKKAKKRKKWLRNCKARIVCDGIFIARYKRTDVCTDCADVIRRSGYQVRRYLRMQEPKYTEKITWLDDKKTRAKLEIKNVVPMYVGDKTVGETDNITVVEVDKREIVAGLDSLKKMARNVLNQMEETQTKINALPGKPVLTVKMKILRKQFEDLQVIHQHDQLEAQLKSQKKNYEKQKFKVEVRSKTLEIAER